MAQIPSYEQWMKDTYSLTRKRSDALKALDETLKPPQDPARIKKALDDWKFEQSRLGKDWRESVRNKKGAATNLYRAVNGLDRRNLSREELEAMKYIARMQAMALQKQFEGKELAFKPNTLIGLKNDAGTKFQQLQSRASALKAGVDTVRSVHGSAVEIRKGAKLLVQGGKAAAQDAASSDLKSKIMDLCKDLCPGMDPNQVFQRLGLGNVEQFSMNLAPFVGAISAGGKAVVGWIKVAKTGWDKHKIAGTRYAFAPKDPEAAFDAILLLLHRELGSNTAKASVATGAFTGKLLGSFADAGAVTGPVIGLLETLAEIFQTIVEYVRDYKEVEKANQLLRLGALNLDLFGVCPILGCYFLVVQDHSTIINFAVGDYGTPNFVFDAERLIKKIHPVLDRARGFISESRFEIVGFASAKGVVAESWGVKSGLGKLTSLPDHISDSITDRIGQWIDKPEKPPEWDRSRIVGFGSGSTRP
jgi:hypothetical protein